MRRTRRGPGAVRVAVQRILPPSGHALLVVCLALCPWTAHAQDGFLQRMRDNVRGVPGQSPPPPPDAPKADDRPRGDADQSHRDDRRHRSKDWYDDDDSYTLREACGIAFGVVAVGVGGTAVAVTSPLWVPKMIIERDSTGGFFPGYPYGDVPGYMITNERLREPDAIPECEIAEDDPLAKYYNQDLMPPRPPHTRNWAGRIRFDYADDFDALDRIGGHLLLSTTSRFGLDTEMNYYREALPGGFHDHLWLGDCNVVYRFAQSDRAQFRTGIGFNWLDDPVATNYGFNFTYGADFFPRKPWIFSATLDWGNLGSAELFRFRTSAGLIVHRFEIYTGYEYLDIDNSQSGSLVGGVRIWF